MKQAIYKLSLCCGRMGDLEGVFLATKPQVAKLISSKIEVYFGEVLGKHSEIFGAIEKKDLKLLTDDPIAVEIVKKYKLTNGINPFKYSSVNFELEGVDLDDMTVGEIIDRLLIQKNDSN
ncbi:hypothetical protein [Flavobacterium laiguense]|uniref:Uncharacterized protein n=1 Tax=Flavobacterium laiguense TaxID=2169409 RepID=A0A2U1K126_9FLAO|nr:hypothetical protein [Flavobacterium laiguense]PWA10945.1 hypothetical protein DB891_03700 [Flavobacterium laiguense]